jgi:hypothetical protein
MMARLLLIPLLLAGCTRLSVQIAAGRFADALSRADLQALRDGSSRRLNSEVWEQVDSELVDKIRQAQTSGPRRPMQVEIVRTDVRNGRARLHLRMAGPEDLEPVPATVELASEDGWRVDDILLRDELSLRRLATCYLAMYRFAVAIGRKDLKALRDQCSEDLASRVVDRLSDRHLDYEIHPAGRGFAQESAQVGEDRARVVFRRADDLFGVDLTMERGAWRIDDVQAPQGSVKTLLVGALAVERLLLALAAGDREAVRDAVTEEFWRRAKLTDEMIAAIQAGLGRAERRVEGSVRVRTEEGKIKLVFEGLQVVEADVVEGRGVDDIRFGGASVADHLDIAVLLMAFSAALSRGDREEIAALCDEKFGALWLSVRERAASEMALHFVRSDPRWPGQGGWLVIGGDSAVLTAPSNEGDLSVRLKRTPSGWRVSDLKMGIGSLTRILPLADPLFAMISGLESMSPQILADASTLWRGATADHLRLAQVPQLEVRIDAGSL